VPAPMISCQIILLAYLQFFVSNLGQCHSGYPNCKSIT
jgi:hypothetical protein